MIEIYRCVGAPARRVDIHHLEILADRPRKQLLPADWDRDLAYRSRIEHRGLAGVERIRAKHAERRAVRSADGRIRVAFRHVRGIEPTLVERSIPLLLYLHLLAQSIAKPHGQQPVGVPLQQAQEKWSQRFPWSPSLHTDEQLPIGGDPGKQL